MFPMLWEYEVRKEQYRDLLRESVFERLAQRVGDRSRRRLEDISAERHEPGRPYVWCVPVGLEPACVAV